MARAVEYDPRRMNHPFADLALARRLERCEASANAAFVEARARVSPEVGAAWIDVGGAYAMFDGVGSALTQTFGLGIFTTPTSDDLTRIEEFFESRGAEPMHEVSPLASTETMELLVARGYRPIELSTMLFQPIGERPPVDTRITTRITSHDEAGLWARTAADGWGVDFVFDLARVSAVAAGTSPFLAELDGRPIGTGALVIHEGVAPASTIESARNQGAQRALLEARLRHAAAQGCDLAMVATAPGSGSQRNAERQGFRIAYTRIKWGRMRVA
jgi:GNAT superfamily N-acetyltransferase